MSQNKKNEDEVEKEKDCDFSSILSLLQEEHRSAKILEYVRQLLTYLPSFDISEVDEGCLNVILPVIKNSLRKSYDDSFVLSDTLDDEFVFSLVKENLQVSLRLLGGLKLVLEFIACNSGVTLNQIESVPVNTAHILLATFEHCKKSTDTYKKSHNSELLEMFRISQEIHLLFLNVLESTTEACDLVNGNKELNIILEVLDILCEISFVLTDMNMKSMTDNWKGYMAIVQKCLAILKEAFSLETPIKSLISQIVQQFTLLDVLEPVDEKYSVRIVNVTAFLIKVTMKLLDLFWDGLETIPDVAVQFCLVIYSFPLDLYKTLNYPEAMINLMKINIITLVDSLASKMYAHPDIQNVISSGRKQSSASPFGATVFFNNLMAFVLEEANFEVTDIQLNEIIEEIFKCLSLYSYEHYYDSGDGESLFEKLIVNISACVMAFPHLYSEVEEILMENILQGNMFCMLLAVEILNMIMINSNQQFQLDALKKLIYLYEQCNFGINTYRPEDVYLKYLIRRLFRTLPYTMKVVLSQTYKLSENTDMWRVVSLRSYPEQQKPDVMDLCNQTNEIIQRIEEDNFGMDDLLCIGTRLETLASANLKETVFDPTKSITSTIGILWNMELNDFSNNVFKYFITKLLGITATLVTKFSIKQLFLIFNKLRILAGEDDLKILVCSVLKSFAEKNTNELGQEAYKIFTAASHVFYPHLLNANNSIVKQYILEIIDLYYQKNKHDSIKELMKTSQENKNELSCYLEKRVPSVPFSKHFFVDLGKIEYQHLCVELKVIDQPVKRFKAENTGIVIQNMKHDEPQWTRQCEIPVNQIPRHEKPQVVRKSKEKEKKEDRMPDPSTAEELQFDDVDEAIATIRADVKALVKLLKTERMTHKHVSHLKLLTRELLSFVNL